MSTLYRNDKVAAFPNSWYAATVTHPPLRPDLRGTQTADVCVIGAGYTGLTAARTLAAKGLSVIVLEAHRAGFGASGRNGGQVATGLGLAQRDLIRKYGEAPARALWDFSLEATADVAANCTAFGPETCHRWGIAHGCYTDTEYAKHAQEARFLADHYGYAKIEPQDKSTFAETVKTTSYAGGVIDRGGAHIHPLRYALALARATEDAGAVIYENSPAHHIAKGDTASVRTSKGRVNAKHVVIATNGYIAGLDRQVAAKVVPLNSFIIATEPLEDRAKDIIAEDIAVEDSKHFVNYYRMSEDKRLLFGGRASAKVAFPTDIAGLLRPRMTDLFPRLGDVRIDFAWGGALGVTATGIPAALRVAPNILSAGGFNGHGVALSGLCGKIMGEAIAGQAGRFDTLATLPTVTFPGGPLFGRSVLGLYLAWQGLREKLGV